MQSCLSNVKLVRKEPSTCHFLVFALVRGLDAKVLANPKCSILGEKSCLIHVLSNYTTLLGTSTVKAYQLKGYQVKDYQLKDYQVKGYQVKKGLLNNGLKKKLPGKRLLSACIVKGLLGWHLHYNSEA
jgi:hypothetical protein